MLPGDAAANFLEDKIKLSSVRFQQLIIVLKGDSVLKGSLNKLVVAFQRKVYVSVTISVRKSEMFLVALRLARLVLKLSPNWRVSIAVLHVCIYIYIYNRITCYTNLIKLLVWNPHSFRLIAFTFSHWI